MPISGLDEVNGHAGLDVGGPALAGCVDGRPSVMVRIRPGSPGNK